MDNVDDGNFLDILSSGQSQVSKLKRLSRPLRGYLPHCERGSIIVTTRNRYTALKLVEQRDVVIVELMDNLQVLALFEKKLRV